MAGPDTEPSLTEALATVAQLVDHNVIHYPGTITNFAGERDSLLATAAATGYDWAVMLDTDERLVPNGREWQEIRAILGTETDPPADVFMVAHVGGTYEKERIFRLPARGHYHGRTHEAFLLDPGAVRRTLQGIAFDEIAKTPEQYRAKVERDLPLLEQMTEEDPDDPRWWYYLGDTYSGLGKPKHAIPCFENCYVQNGWDEESAWAAYRAAELYCAEGDYESGLSWAVSGLERHPGMAELPWLAGWCCYQLGQYRKAVWWEEMAIALNADLAHQERIGFRYPPALFEAPHDVLRYCYLELGLEAKRIDAQVEFEVLLAMRQEKIAAS